MRNLSHCARASSFKPLSTNSSTRPVFRSCLTGSAQQKWLWRQRLSLRSRPMSSLAQHSLPATYYRGGTSRAIFFHRDDLPASQSEWPAIFRGCLGSPDEYGRQLDGLGGGISSLSKICVVSASSRPDADVDYTFAAVGVTTDEVDFAASCGNMTAAVGPWAVDEGVFQVQERGGDAVLDVVVRIFNTNTSKIIHAHFPIHFTWPRSGKEHIVKRRAMALYQGELGISGVSGVSAAIRLDFISPAGSKTGKLLPTGKVVDVIDGTQATCIDVGNPAVFVRAADLGIACKDTTPDDLAANPALLANLDRIRRRAAVLMGVADSLDSVPGGIPKICLVDAAQDAHGGPAPEYQDPTRQTQDATHALNQGKSRRARVPLEAAAALLGPGPGAGPKLSQSPARPAEIPRHVAHRPPHPQTPVQQYPRTCQESESSGKSGASIESLTPGTVSSELLLGRQLNAPGSPAPGPFAPASNPDALRVASAGSSTAANVELQATQRAAGDRKWSVPVASLVPMAALANSHEAATASPRAAVGRASMSSMAAQTATPPPGASPTKRTICVRALSVGQPHRAVPVTTALALAAAADVRGTIVESLLARAVAGAYRGTGTDAGTGTGTGSTLTIEHPTGTLDVEAQWAGEGSEGGEGANGTQGADGQVGTDGTRARTLAAASVYRTARRLFAGDVYWR